MSVVEISAESKTSGRTHLVCGYAVEGLTSISLNFLMNGIAFLTTQRMGWTTAQTLLLMMAQGVLYAAGALSAGKVAQKYSKPSVLLWVNLVLLGLVLLLQLANSPGLFVTILLLHTFTSTLTWPLVESLITEGCDAKRMNRRITAYNMTWSSVCVAVIAVYGTLLEHWPAGPMTIAITCHAISLCCAVVLKKSYVAPAQVETDSHAHGDPEVAAKLAHCRRTAMWLARISLPASFVVVNTLMGIFPKLQASTEMGVQLASVVASLWMAGRFVTFIVLGATSFWHTRPKLLLVGGVLMLLSFLMIVLPAERIGPFSELPLNYLIAIIAVSELLLGVIGAYVFSASLYFGMVLSDGSTEHGSYHEALIGAGMILGPGIAAGAQMTMAQSTQMPSVAAVTTVLLIALGFAFAVSAKSENVITSGNPDRA